MGLTRRRLTGAELDAYDVLPRALAQRVWVVQVPLLAPGSSGMSFRRTVLLLRDDVRDGSSRLLAHELVHVRQYYELGVTGFLVRYLAAYTRQLVTLRRHRAAYYAIPFEREAYRLADEWQLRHANPSL